MWPKRGPADAFDRLAVLSGLAYVRPASLKRVRDETAENKHGPHNKERRALADEPRRKDEGWTDEGHAFVGREVVRSTSATAQSVGTIYCWLPPTVEDCYEDEDGKPAPLFKVRFWWGNWTATSKI